jgi:hypothetical protein
MPYSYDRKAVLTPTRQVSLLKAATSDLEHHSDRLTQALNALARDFEPGIDGADAERRAAKQLQSIFKTTDTVQNLLTEVRGVLGSLSAGIVRGKF